MHHANPWSQSVYTPEAINATELGTHSPSLYFIALPKMMPLQVCREYVVLKGLIPVEAPQEQTCTDIGLRLQPTP